MKFNCFESKRIERYNCLGVKGFLILISAIGSLLFSVFTWIYVFLSIFALPFVIVGWIKEKYFD